MRQPPVDKLVDGFVWRFHLNAYLGGGKPQLCRRISLAASSPAPQERMNLTASRRLGGSFFCTITTPQIGDRGQHSFVPPARQKRAPVAGAFLRSASQVRHMAPGTALLKGFAR